VTAIAQSTTEKTGYNYGNPHVRSIGWLGLCLRTVQPSMHCIALYCIVLFCIVFRPRGVGIAVPILRSRAVVVSPETIDEKVVAARCYHPPPQALSSCLQGMMLLVMFVPLCRTGHSGRRQVDSFNSSGGRRPPSGPADWKKHPPYRFAVIWGWGRQAAGEHDCIHTSRPPGLRPGDGFRPTAFSHSQAQTLFKHIMSLIHNVTITDLMQWPCLSSVRSQGTTAGAADQLVAVQSALTAA
jgi:hypothetical protein